MDLFGLPAIHKVKNETDVTTVALAFARIASNKLKVPVKCFTFLWNYPHRCQTTGERLIDVTLNIHILDDELRETMEEGNDHKCFMCYSACEDADEPKATTTREWNCAECMPCSLCPDCRIILDDGTARCLDCMTTEDIPRVRDHGTARDVYRRRVIVPEIDWPNSK